MPLAPTPRGVNQRSPAGNRMSRTLATRTSRFVYYAIIPITLLAATAVYTFIRDLPEEIRARDPDREIIANEGDDDDEDALRRFGLQVHMDVMAKVQAEHRDNVASLEEQIRNLTEEKEEALIRAEKAEDELRRCKKRDSVLVEENE